MVRGIRHLIADGAVDHDGLRLDGVEHYREVRCDNPGEAAEDGQVAPGIPPDALELGIVDEEMNPATVIPGRDSLVKGREVGGDGVGAEHRRDSHQPGWDDALEEVKVENSSIRVIFHGNTMPFAKVNGTVSPAWHTQKLTVGVHATLALAVGTPIPTASSF